MVGHMLGHVDRSTAVLAAERQALQDADEDERDRREPAGGFVGGQQTDGSRGAAHDDQGDEEGDFAACHVSNAAEEERAEGADEEADGEGGQIGDEGEGVVTRRIELGGEDRSERAEDVEVVPLDHGSGRGGEDDVGNAGLAGLGRRGVGSHALSDLVQGAQLSCPGSWGRGQEAARLNLEFSC